jgi:hypothetical protein
MHPRQHNQRASSSSTELSPELIAMCQNKDFEGAYTVLQQAPGPVASASLFKVDGEGRSPMCYSLEGDAHWSLVELMLERGKSDPGRRNLAAFCAEKCRVPPLVLAARHTSHDQVLAMLAREQPDLLLRKHEGSVPYHHSSASKKQLMDALTGPIHGGQTEAMLALVDDILRRRSAKPLNKPQPEPPRMMPPQMPLAVTVPPPLHAPNPQENPVTAETLSRSSPRRQHDETSAAVSRKVRIPCCMLHFVYCRPY